MNAEETMFPGEPEVQDEDFAEIRSTLLQLADARKIKYTSGYIKKVSNKTLESIHANYTRQQLDETNNHLADTLITKFSEIMVMLKTVKDDGVLEEELAENELLRRDLKNIVGYVTPYIPLVGVLSGGLTVGKLDIKCTTD